MYCQVVAHDISALCNKKKEGLKPSLTLSQISYYLPVPMSFLMVRFAHFTVLATL